MPYCWRCGTFYAMLSQSIRDGSNRGYPSFCVHCEAELIRIPVLQPSKKKSSLCRPKSQMKCIKTHASTTDVDMHGVRWRFTTKCGRTRDPPGAADAAQDRVNRPPRRSRRRVTRAHPARAHPAQAHPARVARASKTAPAHKVVARFVAQGGPHALAGAT